MSDHEQDEYGERITLPEDREDKEELREYGRQLALNSLLCNAFTVAAEGNPQGSEAGANKVVRFGRFRRRTAWAMAAAACLIGFIGIAIWRSGKSPVLDSRWTVTAGMKADYQILAPDRVKLRSGELRFASSAPAPLVVETPLAVATAKGTEFLIGHHDDFHINETKLNQEMKRREVTRMLVLSGMVNMASSHGSVAAGKGEAAVTEPDAAPYKIAVQANSQFAFDLYHQLAGEERNAGKNMFFSPYSISNALLMTAEGARGQTAAEMGEVLGFPEALRRKGRGAQQIPWEMGKMHVGLSAMNRLFNRGRDTPEQVKLRAQEADLKQRLAAVREEIEEHKRSKNRDARKEAAKRERALLWELIVLQPKIDSLELSIANALWGEKSVPFAEDYEKTIASAYKTESGGIQMADFISDPEGERKRINAWVMEHTNDRIKDLLPEGSLTPMTRLALVNAVFFKADWAVPFDKADTLESDFTLASDRKVRVNLMRNTSGKGTRYAAFTGDGKPYATPLRISASADESLISSGPDGFSMVELPYRGGEMSMLVVAPNRADGLPAIEKRLGTESLGQWMTSLKRREVHVRLPKFKMNTAYDLKSSLTAMGMPSAFKFPAADFSGMTGGSNEFYIGMCRHKAFVEVNETGTEAAAATGMAAAGGSAPTDVPFTPTFRADRPFLYLIRDVKSGAILFLGRVADPNQ